MKVNNIDLSAVDTTVPESNSFQAIPPGKYRVMISKAEYKETAAGTGMRLPLELTIVGGDFSGRIVFEGLNLQNPNPQAEQIGRQRLAEICDAVGLERNNFNDTDQIEGKMVTATVTRSMIKDPTMREKYGDDQGMENSVSRFSAPNDKPAPRVVRVEAEPFEFEEDEAPF